MTFKFSTTFIVLSFALSLCFFFTPAMGADLALLVLDHNSYIADQAVRSISDSTDSSASDPTLSASNSSDSSSSNPDPTDPQSQDRLTELSLDIQVINADDVTRHPEKMKAILGATPIVVVDVMGRELEAFMVDNIALKGKTLYALRGSLDDESLKKRGFIFDPEVSGYYQHLSIKNIQNMLRLVIHRHIDDQVNYQPIATRPKLGIYHPDASQVGCIFTDVDDYWAWQHQRQKPKNKENENENMAKDKDDDGDTDKHGDRYGNGDKKGEERVEENPTIALFFFSSFLTKGQQEPIDHIIHRLESEGFNVIPCYGKEEQIIRNYLLKGPRPVDMVLAFSFKFYSALSPKLTALVEQLNVPIFNAVSLYKETLDAWRKSPVGVGQMQVAWSLAAPELTGIVEPTVLSAKEKIIDPVTGKSYFLSRLVEENMDRLIPRLKNWKALQQKPNREKRVALMFYNHSQGKQNIGASYLNVFESIESILAALKQNGYDIGQEQGKIDPKGIRQSRVEQEGIVQGDCSLSSLSAEEIKSLILKSARNVGSWAPGELDKLMAGGKVVRLPISTYTKWFDELPEAFKEKVIEQWGPPETSKIMRSGNDIIIPAIRLNNIVLLPEPSRGWGDDPMKMMHDVTLQVHHQYIAVYLWLQKAFRADAMIHLGTHSTYEWTPGKQAGLSPSCTPEVMIGDIPNLYPYIVDNVGEGIQAKRRGRGVMISHLTPTLRESDLHDEYSRMAELVGEIERAEARGSVTVQDKADELLSLAKATGILEDLKFETVSRDHDIHHQKEERSTHQHPDKKSRETNIKPDTVVSLSTTQQEQIHLLGHYLEEIKSEIIPYGMHTFGISPVKEEAEEMTQAVIKWNPPSEADSTVTPERVLENLNRSGTNEMASLVRGLSGRYVPPGPGNDPLRNPEALPTGRNFYGFNPGKLPSPAAWALGKKAAEKIIENHIIKHGNYPQKVAVVLWATETLRNEGVNESTILYLIGARPRWSKTGRILGVELISGDVLQRPRIDVMINASGLYRDLFPEKMQYIDHAIRLAEKAIDVENLIARNSAAVKTRLIQKGMDPEKAEEMSRFRVFSEPPGAYGTGVSEMASGSSKWDDPNQVVDVFENRVGYAFGGGKWGMEAKTAFKESLSHVDVTVHSKSSNVYGLMDNDDMFQYLGGLSMAVRKESGKAPETLITQQQKRGRINVEDVGKTIGREMRARYLNPKWIEGMKAEDYAGARAMADFVEYLWGWDMTTPDKVDDAKWQQTYDVYVEDKYDLELKDFFEKASPWAYQSMTGRMLETHRKGYWQADQKELKTLAAEYAKSIVAKGIACCDHTCNNPLLNQMVVSIISLPGVVSPELVEQFKVAVEQMAQKNLDQQVEERNQLIDALKVPISKVDAPSNSDNADTTQKQMSSEEATKESTTDVDVVEGYKMEKIESKADQTQMTSSGMEWMAVVMVLAIMGLVGVGVLKAND